MNKVGMIGTELEKISNGKLSYDELVLYIENNFKEYKDLLF